MSIGCTWPRLGSCQTVHSPPASGHATRRAKWLTLLAPPLRDKITGITCDPQLAWCLRASLQRHLAASNDQSQSISFNRHQRAPSGGSANGRQPTWLRPMMDGFSPGKLNSFGRASSAETRIVRRRSAAYSARSLMGFGSATEQRQGLVSRFSPVRCNTGGSRSVQTRRLMSMVASKQLTSRLSALVVVLVQSVRVYQVCRAEISAQRRARNRHACSNHAIGAPPRRTGELRARSIERARLKGGVAESDPHSSAKSRLSRGSLVVSVFLFVAHCAKRRLFRLCASEPTRTRLIVVVELASVTNKPKYSRAQLLRSKSQSVVGEQRVSESLL